MAKSTLTFEEWKNTGQYPSGEKLNPKDKRLEEYFKGYQEAVAEAPPAHRREIERQHGIIDTSTATEPEKEAYVEYVQSNPDLRENAEALGLTRQETAEFGQKHYETFGVGKYVYSEETGGGVYGKNLEDRANYIAAGITSVIGDPGAFQRDYGASDEAFEAAIRGYADPNNWLYGGGDPSQLWQARGLIGEEFGDPWNLQGFSGKGWNMSPDNPYARGIRAGTIDVAKDVGQLLDTGDTEFLQDRYEDEYRKEDFPEKWVDDKGNWQGPPDLGEYWNAISTAVRNEAGELRSLIPSTQWTKYGTPEYLSKYGTGLVNYEPPGQEILTTPYTRPGLQDWSNIMPPEGLLTTPAQRAIVADQGANYQPWAQGGLIEYSPAGTAAYVPPAYVPPPSNNQNNQNNGQLNNQGNQQTDFSSLLDFNANLAAQHEDNYPNKLAAANLAGFSGLSATNMNPDYVAYQDALKNYMSDPLNIPYGSTYDAGGRTYIASPLGEGNRFYGDRNWQPVFGNMTPAEINAAIGYGTGE